ncbi:hypothetical protein ASF90_17940 [Xanthomonas sp. Leaf148]|nr:hypothetical protein ASF90_17940 [Xanthomonas sp. Leaf148]
MLAVFVLHVVFAVWLIHLSASHMTSQRDITATRITLTFIAGDPSPAPTPPVLMRQPATKAPTRTNTRLIAIAQQPIGPTLATPSPLTPGMAATGTPGLNLHVHDTTPVIAASSQRLLTPPDALPVDTTRFNQAWAPDGGEVQQTWAFRSGLARAALSMTGALRQPCNQRERDQRLEKCFGRQYQSDVEPPASPGR